MNRRMTVTLALLVLLVILGSGLACGSLGCPEGSTWTADCYNFRGEYVGSASDDGCNCDCSAVMCGARVVNCNVYEGE